MDYQPIRSNSESSTTIYVEQYHQLGFSKSHWSKMYPQKSQQQQQLDSSKLGNSLDDSAKNFSHGLYPTKQSLSVDTMPKKENIWQTMYRSATNLLNERLSRGSGSLIKNWSNMNNPLSVTVVSQDFFKSLPQGKDHQLVNPTEGFYTTKTWIKDSQSNDEMLTIPNVLYNNEIMSVSVKRSNSDTSDSDKRWKEYKNLYVDFNGQEKDSKKDQKIVNSVNKSDCKDESLESHLDIVDSKKDLDTSTNFGNTLTVDDEPVMLEKPEPTQTQKQEQQSESQETSLPSQPTIVTTMLSNAYNKVVNGVADLLQLRSSDTEPSSSLFTKRSSSPKPRPKRLHNISSGRGRGRAKSQLRKSGVSQKRHRKERSRYDCSEDIKNDIDNWEEFEYCNDSEDEKFEDIEDMDVTDFAGSQPMRPTSFTLADVKPKKRKPKKSKNCGWSQLGVAISVQNLDIGGDLENCKEFRPRLLSESSVDSEDSYCIVFEDDKDSDDSDFEIDEESCDESETETETESEDEEVMADSDVEAHPTKVRFDLTPTIHPMIQWNYAYRAARRGPWEEMARDRERFRSRIHCIGRILEPVLVNQHRMRIWHERFED